jgi:CRP-like cAMP-binding protein
LSQASRSHGKTRLARANAGPEGATCRAAAAHPHQQELASIPKAFDFSGPPFDRLRPPEVDRVNQVVDIVFFRAGRKVIGAGSLPDHFYVLIKGLVEERASDEILAVHEGGDGFDSEILVYQSCRHDFFVREEAICYALPMEDFLELTANNPAFAAFFYKDTSHRLEALGQRQSGPAALGGMTTRVRQAPVNPPVFVPAETTLHEAALHMEREGQRALLVRDGNQVGIFTGVDLTRAAVAERQPHREARARPAQGFAADRQAAEGGGAPPFPSGPVLSRRMLQRLKRAWWRQQLEDAAFAHLGEPYDGDELVSIDCETTGLDVRRDQILPIGAIKVKGG